MKSINQIMLILAIMLVANTGGPLQAMDIHKNSLNAKFIEAMRYRNENEMNNLLEQGAEVDYEDSETGTGRTPLFLAIEGESPEIARFLIEKGANVNHQDKESNSPLIHATLNNRRLDIARLLIEKGAQVNHQDKYGLSALMGAAAHDKLHLVRLLIENGADAGLKDKMGRTALVHAQMNSRSIEIYKTLTEAMLKLTKEQKDSVYALIASLKRTPELQTNRDTRRLIAQFLIDTYKKENRAKTRAEIEKIQNGELRNQLLKLLEKQ